MLKRENCAHLKPLEFDALKKSEGYECEECVKLGSNWVHLRTCQTCGVTLCCDSSPNKHASRHARLHDHPVASSAEPGERWAYCYAHEELRMFRK